MSATLDQILAKASRLVDAPILFAGPGRFCGPGPGVLLLHPAGKAHMGTWELPTSTEEIGMDIFVDDPVPFGDSLLVRVDAQFEPTLSAKHHDDFLWCICEYASDFRNIINPSTFAAIEQFTAGRGDHQVVTGDLEMESRSAFVDAQMKAHKVAQAFGDAAGAPPPLSGESLLGYRCRLAKPYQSHSTRFRDSDLTRIFDSNALSVVEDAIYADAAAALHSGATVPADQMRAVIKMDGAGRPITYYVASDPGACWHQFAPPIRYVRRFLTPGTFRAV